MRDLSTLLDRTRHAVVAVARTRELLDAAQIEAARCRVLCVNELQAQGRDVELLDALLGGPAADGARNDVAQLAASLCRSCEPLLQPAAPRRRP